MWSPTIPPSLNWPRPWLSLHWIRAIVSVGLLLYPCLHMNLLPIQMQKWLCNHESHHVTPVLKIHNGSSFYSKQMPKFLGWTVCAPSGLCYLSHLIYFNLSLLLLPLLPDWPHPLASEPLHLLFPLPRRLLLQVSTRIIPSPPWRLLQMVAFTEAFLDHLI